MKKKIKILFLDHTPFIGGAQLSLVSHLKEIDRKAFDFLIACSKDASQNGLSEIYDSFNFKYYFIPFDKLKIFKFSSIINFFRSVKTVVFLIKKEEIDIVFGNTVRADVIATVAAFLTRKKSLWFIQDVTFPKILFKFLYIFTDKVLYVSHYVARYYSVSLGKKNSIIHIWRDRVGGNLYSEKELRERWRCGKDTFVIGYIGRLVRDKGVHILIDVVEKIILKKKNSKIKCVIVGSGSNQEGDYEYFLRNKIREKKLEKYFFFEGFNKNIFSFLNSFSVLCQTSVAPEGLPTVILEAMLSRVPVIATDVGGTKEVVIHKKTGLLIEPNDSEALLDGIYVIMKDKALRENMILKACNNIDYNFSSFKKSRDLESVYSKLTKK